LWNLPPHPTLPLHDFHSPGKITDPAGRRAPPYGGARKAKTCTVQDRPRHPGKSNCRAGAPRGPGALLRGVFPRRAPGPVPPAERRSLRPLCPRTRAARFADRGATHQALVRVMSAQHSPLLTHVPSATRSLWRRGRSTAEDNSSGPPKHEIVVVAQIVQLCDLHSHSGHGVRALALGGPSNGHPRPVCIVLPCLPPAGDFVPTPLATPSIRSWLVRLFFTAFFLICGGRGRFGILATKTKLKWLIPDRCFNFLFFTSISLVLLILLVVLFL